jgi:type II secretory ATPase GspE/PulE/Tfp pilus assembly ATPase PilB-like protein/ActR/RegA family two-component response regulator
MPSTGAPAIAVKTTKQHWMVDLVRRSGLINAELLVLDAKTTTDAAWAEVCRVCHVTEELLAERVAAHFKLPVANLTLAEARVLKLVPASVARRYGVIPLRESDRHLVVATANPVDIAVEQALAFASSRTPVFEIAPPAALRAAQDAKYSPDRTVETMLQDVAADAIDDVEVLEESETETVAARELDAAPVVRLTKLILQQAIMGRASDIHIEPGRSGGVVRFRIDGVMHQHLQLPMASITRLVSRIKILGKLDIADRMRPQDGGARVQVHGKAYDLRISTVPTRDAEKAVIRILDASGSQRLEDLGMAAPELTRLRQLLAHRDGIVVVTGPTGSGKTTTLYAAISELATGKINIMTVEDPVEYELGSITQIQVDPKRGVTFASALRAILRQDPDVIFVGEIRDLEAAEIAVQASITGHLVLASLHTNDAVGVFPRLVDLGLSKVSIAGALRGVMAQRLVRRLCERCRVEITGALTDSELQLSRRHGLRPKARAAGCEHCGQTGFRGRIAVSDVLINSPELQRVVISGGGTSDLERAAAAGGMRSMRVAALEMVARGVTTLEEIDRVLGEAAEAKPAPAVEQPRVLLVDDDAVVRRLGRTLLEKNGFSITEVSDGSAALEHLIRDPEYSLMVLDLSMPAMGGMEVLRHVRRTASVASLPVVILTGSDEQDSEADIMDAGADDYIRKPIDPARFVARIKAVLRRAVA